jgi:NAD(P)-dependent dehydrogenase (short-subunit alcohol dehydrogenase family)
MDSRWTEANIPDLHGRLAVVTGANSGIGWQTVRALAAKGAHVVMAVRSAEKGQEAKAAILREFPGAEVEVSVLDLSDLGSGRQFADSFLTRFSSLSLLINNAGVMGVPYAKTKDGFELQFGTNHLGHFALTGLLLPALLKDGQARIVTVSSGAHLNAQLDFDDLQSEQGYRRWRAYGRSKLANLLFSYELQRRLEASGVKTISAASHPGWAATSLATKSVGARHQHLGKIVQGLFNVGAQSAARGALPTLYAATEPSVQGGEFIGPIGMGGMRGYPGRARSSDRSHNTEDARRLWSISERLTGVRYEALDSLH